MVERSARALDNEGRLSEKSSSYLLSKWNLSRSIFVFPVASRVVENCLYGQSHQPQGREVGEEGLQVLIIERRRRGEHVCPGGLGLAGGHNYVLLPPHCYIISPTSNRRVIWKPSPWQHKWRVGSFVFLSQAIRTHTRGNRKNCKEILSDKRKGTLFCIVCMF